MSITSPPIYLFSKEREAPVSLTGASDYLVWIVGLMSGIVGRTMCICGLTSLHATNLLSQEDVAKQGGDTLNCGERSEALHCLLGDF